MLTCDDLSTMKPDVMVEAIKGCKLRACSIFTTAIFSPIRVFQDLFIYSMYVRS